MSLRSMVGDKRNFGQLVQLTRDDEDRLADTIGIREDGEVAFMHQPPTTKTSPSV